MGRKAKVEQLRETDDVFLDAIVDRFGDTILSNLRGDNVEAMTTGCLSLDACIGIGGIPKGRFTEIYGPEGSGKTTIALSISQLAVERDEKVLYIDAENMLSYGAIGQMLGKVTDQKKLLLIQPETAEQAFMIAEKGITSGEFSLVVIDTIAALEPEAEKENEFDQHTMAVLSRLLAKFFRRNASDVKNNNVAVLLLNQVRDKVGSYTGGYESPGGHALRHYSSVRIPLTKGQEIKVDGTSIGINTRFVIKKNKLAPPFRGFEIPIIFGTGVDFYMDAVSFCETIGVLQKAGSFYKFEGETIGQGRHATAEYLKSNKEVLDKVIEMVYNVINKTSSAYVEEDEIAVQEE